MKRGEPRPKSAADVPLDDGPRDGSEPWRAIDGVQFCHWDRWLLRLAATEPQGLDTIAREFRTRANGRAGVDTTTAEVMLAQVVDLRARLERIGRPPDAVLDGEERQRVAPQEGVQAGLAFGAAAKDRSDAQHPARDARGARPPR